MSGPVHIGQATLHHGDSRDVLKHLDPGSIDSVVTDPPYELSNDGKQSANGVFLEFAFPKNAKVIFDGSGKNCLPFLVSKILDLYREGSFPSPTASVPVVAMALDNQPSFRQQEVEHASKSAVEVPSVAAISNVEPQPAQHLGSFAFELTNPTKLFKLLNDIGTGFYAGGIGIGLSALSSSLPSLLGCLCPVIDGCEDVGTFNSSLASLVAALDGTGGDAMLRFDLGRGSVETFTTNGACMLAAVLLASGSKLVRAKSAASCLPTMLESRYIRVVDRTANLAFTFELIVHPQTIATNGFMGKQWDGSKIAYDVAMWKLVYAALKPGGHLLAFGGSRTYHRLACAIEDAGFQIVDQIQWLYGSGFPKSHNLDRYKGNKICGCDCAGGALPSSHAKESHTELQPSPVRNLRSNVGAERPLSGDTEYNLLEGMLKPETCPKQEGKGEEAERTSEADEGGLCRMWSGGSETELPLEASEKANLQSEMQRDASRTGLEATRSQSGESPNGTGTGQLSQENERPEQPGLEGRGYVSSPEGELRPSAICASTKMGEADGPQGRLCDGAPTGHGEADRPNTAAGGNGSSPRSQAAEQRGFESGALAGQSQSQVGGTWPICRRCGLPRVLAGLGTALKPAHEPIVVARKPLGIPAVDNVQTVEYILKNNGFEDRIIWSERNARTAAKKRTPATSIPIKPPAQEEMFAEPARGYATRDTANVTELGYASGEESGSQKTPNVARNYLENTPNDLGRAFSVPTAASAPVVGKQPSNSLPSTISAGADGSTECPSVVTSTEICKSEATPKGSAFCVGTATAQSDDTEAALTLLVNIQGKQYRIEQVDDGSLVWPSDLPKFIPARSLTVAENVLTHGTGALNIDGCRVAVDPIADVSQLRTMNRGRRTEDTSGQAWGYSKPAGDTPQVVRPDGRWPANVIHDGSDEVMAAFPDAPGQSGAVTGREPSSKTNNVYGQFEGRPATLSRGDLGSAARFFYCAKASRKDRDEGNHHPTVKPTELMRYLTRLVTPSGGTVLDPFMGSGSTGKAALREGFRFIGIEREPEYFRIACARIEPGHEQPEMILKMPEREPEPDREPDLFGFTAA